MTTGTRYFLLELAQHIPGLQNLPLAAFYLLCALIFAALNIWAWRTAAQPDSPTAGLPRPQPSPSPPP